MIDTDWSRRYMPAPGDPYSDDPSERGSYYGRRDLFIVRTLFERPDWLPTRVLSKLTGYPDASTCWVWQGAISGNYGYGTVGIPKSIEANRQARVHRVVWIATRGQIADGLVLDHDGPEGCHNRACANPEHLQAVTPRHNTVTTGTGLFAQQALRTECPQGHPLSGSNLDPTQLARGQRACHECRLRVTREFNATIRAVSRLLGMTKKEYGATHGWSMSPAEALIDTHRKVAA